MTAEVRLTNAQLSVLAVLPSDLTTGQRRAMKALPTSITELERQIAVERRHWRRNLLERRVVQIQAQHTLKSRRRRAAEVATRRAAERDQDVRLRD